MVGSIIKLNDVANGEITSTSSSTPSSPSTSSNNSIMVVETSNVNLAINLNELTLNYNLNPINNCNVVNEMCSIEISSPVVDAKRSSIDRNDDRRKTVIEICEKVDVKTMPNPQISTPIIKVEPRIITKNNHCDDGSDVIEKAAHSILNELITTIDFTTKPSPALPKTNKIELSTSSSSSQSVSKHNPPNPIVVMKSNDFKYDSNQRESERNVVFCSTTFFEKKDLELKKQQKFMDFMKSNLMEDDDRVVDDDAAIVVGEIKKVVQPSSSDHSQQIINDNLKKLEDVLNGIHHLEIDKVLDEELIKLDGK